MTDLKACCPVNCVCIIKVRTAELEEYERSLDRLLGDIEKAKAAAMANPSKVDRANVASSGGPRTSNSANFSLADVAFGLEHDDILIDSFSTTEGTKSTSGPSDVALDDFFICKG
jgi:hypothetical protein